MRSALAIALAALALAWPGSARAQAEPPGATVLEVDHGADPGEVTVLIDHGHETGLERGLTVELRRDGKTIGYGTVITVFATRAVAHVGTVVAGASPLVAGDTVRFHGQGFAPPPQQPAPAEPQEPRGELPHGSVVGVRETVVLLDFGEDSGSEQGDVISVRDADGNVRGRVEIELVDRATSVGRLVSGEISVGDAAVTVSRRATSEGGLDFVALSFLGVVADLEHPNTPHRAPCHVGVPVRRVMAGSPAQQAGIGPGDRVVAVDDWIVRDAADIRDRIEARESTTVRVALIRGGKLLFVNVSFRE